MNYDEIAREIESLNYRDKFRLAQLLLQQARKEEETKNPQSRGAVQGDVVPFVAERLLKLKPSKRSSLHNAISAMFQFQGGLSDGDRDRIVNQLQKEKFLSITDTGKVLYL